MAKNCKTSTTDNSIAGVVLPLIFIPGILWIFMPGSKHKITILAIITIVACIIGYKVGKSIKSTVQVCDGD